MASAHGRELSFWQKLHSIAGVVPLGIFTIYHLGVLSFSLSGPETYDRVNRFLYRVPVSIQIGLEALLVWVPLAFHMIYGVIIASRQESNEDKRHHRIVLLQKIAGVFLAVFVIFHFCTTTLQVKLRGNNPEVVNYAAMQAQLSSSGYVILGIYALGVLTASYHLSYGLWTFGKRGAFAGTERAQAAVMKISFCLFVALTFLGWASLAGFFRRVPVYEPRQVHRTLTSIHDDQIFRTSLSKPVILRARDFGIPCILRFAFEERL